MNQKKTNETQSIKSDVDNKCPTITYFKRYANYDWCICSEREKCKIKRHF